MAETYLGEIVIGLGAADGYSGDDLTNARDAAVAGELPYLPKVPDQPPPDALELRIHGVGGAPPEDNLETPSTLQVSGDATAGFFRAWYPGGSAATKPQREAYCWGGLNTRSRWRALWLLLVAFMFVNLSYWALPGRGRVGNIVAKACLRLIGLSLTVAFVGTGVTLMGDIVATQAPGKHVLPAWMGSYEHLRAGPRYAIALLAILAVLGIVVLVSVQTTRSYEKWRGGKFPTSDVADWELAQPNFWRGERTVARQRHCHVAAASAEIMMFAALPSSDSGWRTAILVAAGIIGAVAVVLIVSEWTERSRTSRQDVATLGKEKSDLAAVLDKVGRLFGYGSAALAVAACIARFWWEPKGKLASLPGDQALQTTVIVVEFSLVVVLFFAVLFQAPWKHAKVMAFGFVSPVLAGFACCVASIFGAALTLAVTNFLGTPSSDDPTRTKKDMLFLPYTTYSGGFGMIVAVACALVFAVIAGVVFFVKKNEWKAPGGYVTKGYPSGPAGGDEARKTVAGVWAIASLTDLAPLALSILVLPTTVLFLADTASRGIDGDALAPWVETASVYGGTVGVLAIGFFLVQMRAALLHASARKRFGTLWDVGTFWPRACHPFAPPCYAERSIPELVTRLRRVVGDVERCDDMAKDPAVAQQAAETTTASDDDPLPVEAHRPVLVTGYSQGTPIAVAVVAQLPAAVRERIALLTLAAPVRRLYGRAFPAYFGAPQLDVLREHLTHDGAVWWRNTVRRSDYIGGWILQEIPRDTFDEDDPASAVDHEIYDPPVLWADDDPTPPPTHRHSDMFPDPQAREYAEELMNFLKTAVSEGGESETAA